MFAIAAPNISAAMVAEYGVAVLGFITLAVLLFQMLAIIR
jgi:hypothetical protein